MSATSVSNASAPSAVGGDRGGSAGTPSPRQMRVGNLVVGVVHLLQAVAVLALSNDFAIPVLASFPDGPPGSDPTGTSFTLFDVRFGWAIALFLALAAADHLLMASPGVNGWYERQLGSGLNTARWIEYSVSSSVMIVLICLLTGISSIYALLGIVGANVSMILFGLLMERTNPDRHHVDWWPFLFGCIAGIVPWIAIGMAIVGAQRECSGVPGFVFAIFVSLFVLFNTFAVNQFLQYRRIGPWTNYRHGEAAFIVLSLTAKTALAWQVFGGALAT